MNQTSIHLFIPYGPLPDKTRIKQYEYNTKRLIAIIEQITGKHIISKRENRALKHYQNVSIQFPIVSNKDPYESLTIIGKNKTYLIKPVF